MIYILLVVLAIFGYVLHLNRWLRWPAESSLLFVCASLIGMLYLSGLVGFLQPAARISTVIGGLLFVQAVVFHSRKAILVQFTSPGMLFFLVGIIGLWLLTASDYFATFLFVDDYSHWGRVAKTITDNARLIGPSDEVWFKDYPPGMALFVYLLLQYSGFSASLAMFAQGVFILAAFASFYAVIPRTVSPRALILLGLFVYFLIYFMGTGFHTLSVDLVLGVVFGVALVDYLAVSKRAGLAPFVRLLPLVALLPLIKHAGILFALVSCGVVATEVLVRGVNPGQKARLLLAVAIVGAFSLLTYSSWNSHVKEMGFAKTFNSDISFEAIVKAFAPASATERQATTIRNFTERILLPHRAGDKRQHYYFALCLGLIALIGYQRKARFSVQEWLPLIVLFGGLFCYLAVLLVLYMFAFGGYEGPRLASFARYTNTYLVGMLVVLSGIALRDYMNEPRGKRITVALVTIFVLITLPNLKVGVREIRYAIGGHQDEDKLQIAKYAEIVRKHTPPESRIYLIWQASNGTENTLFNYGILPRSGNRACWSIGKPRFEGDVWSCDVSLPEFEQALYEFDYLLIARADEDLLERYLKSFEIEHPRDGDLFRIMRDGGGLQLRRMVPGNA